MSDPGSSSPVCQQHPVEETGSKQLTLDPNGDVLLLLSSHDREYSIKVSSKSLSLASSVFATMLSPDSPFLEGSELKNVGETQVKLDDDFDALLIVLRIIHLQNKRVPHQVPFETLCHITTVSDKYNLAESVLPWFEIWAVPYRGSVDTVGYERWLFISWVFAKADIFERVSRRFILHAKFGPDGNFVVDTDTEPVEGVPGSIIDAIKSERKRMINSLAAGAQSEVSKYCECGLQGTNICKRPSKRNECDSINFGSLLRGLAVVGLWPQKRDLDGVSVMDLSKDLKGVENFGSEIGHHQWGVSSNQDDHSKCGSKTRFDAMVEDVQSSVRGLHLSQFRPEIDTVSSP